MHPPRNVWQALSRPGYLLSAWPWRSAGYLLTGVVAGVVVLVGIVASAAVGGVFALALVGLPLLLCTALAGIPVAAVERLRLRLVDPDPAPDPHQPPGAPGLRAWLSTRLREAGHLAGVGPRPAVRGSAVAGRRARARRRPAVPVVRGRRLRLLLAAFGEAKVLKVWLVTTWPAAFGSALLGLVLLALGAYLLGVAAGARAGLTRLLIAPREAGLGARVVELARSRVRLVDAFEAERRRIERDLHDGAQQRLVALTMTLGLARLDAPPGPLADQLAKAHEEAGTALAELRELIHGIHPKVLADYGLEAAVADAADRSAVPVDVDLELPGRLSQAVEAAAYFVVCEALANVGRHSGASRAEVSGGHRGGRLVLRIRDDGCGGARAGEGSGLTGLADRVSVLDGRLSLSSPPGGPTLLRVEIPCEPAS